MRNKVKKAVLDGNAIQEFISAAHTPDRIKGSTHTFYRYPARFSPQFARAVIETFSEPGDTILDPFMGGATSLVEAASLGRIGIGFDISELSCFLARVKTSSLGRNEIASIRQWIAETLTTLNVHNRVERPDEWIRLGYQRNINDKSTWPIRKLIELAVDRIQLLESGTVQDFARAIILRTGQWALDTRQSVPPVGKFRQKLEEFSEEMIAGVLEYDDSIIRNSTQRNRNLKNRTVIVNRSAEEVNQVGLVEKYGYPNLVLTSPPYPGVHVLYHRWQVRGRRETPAPFWIANARDGKGLSYYTLGDRKALGLNTYFKNVTLAFRSVVEVANEDTIFVQLIAFSDPASQLPRYLQAMEDAGLFEVRHFRTEAQDGRLWRNVPNRKWYAQQKASGGASTELVLFHRKA